MTVLSSKHYSGHHKAAEEEDDPGTLGEGFRYSWRKMEEVAQDRAGWSQVVCGLCSSGSDKA